MSRFGATYPRAHDWKGRRVAIVGDGSRLGIIGVGAIAAAIVEGLMRTKHDALVVLSPRGADRAAYLASRFPTVTVAPSNQAVVASASGPSSTLIPGAA